jgi:hypothetical protein
MEQCRELQPSTSLASWLRRPLYLPEIEKFSYLHPREKPVFRVPPGNDFLVQPAGSHTSESHQSTRSLDQFIDMPLEERLENCTRFYSAGEFGEMDCCIDTLRKKAFHTFLASVAALLSGRPAYPMETDLLHLLTRAISPQPHKIGARIERDVPPRTKRLRGCIHAHSFHVN